MPEEIDECDVSAKLLSNLLDKMNFVFTENDEIETNLVPTRVCLELSSIRTFDDPEKYRPHQDLVYDFKTQKVLILDYNMGEELVLDDIEVRKLLEKTKSKVLKSCRDNVILPVAVEMNLKGENGKLTYRILFETGGKNPVSVKSKNDDSFLIRIFGFPKKKQVFDVQKIEGQDLYTFRF